MQKRVGNHRSNQNLIKEETLKSLTNVGVLEQSADPGFSLQFLMVYKTVLQLYHNISDLDTHMTAKKLLKSGINANNTLQEDKVAGNCFISFLQINSNGNLILVYKVLSGSFSQGY